MQVDDPSDGDAEWDANRRKDLRAYCEKEEQGSTDRVLHAIRESVVLDDREEDRAHGHDRRRVRANDQRLEGGVVVAGDAFAEHAAMMVKVGRADLADGAVVGALADDADTMLALYVPASLLKRLHWHDGKLDASATFTKWLGDAGRIVTFAAYLENFN